MAGAEGLGFGVGHDGEGGGEAVGEGGGGGEGVAAAGGEGDGLEGAGVHDVLALFGLAGGTEGLVDEGDFAVAVFGVETDGPGGFADGGAEGEEGTVAGIEEGVLDAPVIEDGDGLIEGVAFADGAEVEG